MKWHRIIFWISFIVFLIITIAVEAGHIQKESIIKFLLFVVCTTIGIFILDELVYRLFNAGKYMLFLATTLVTIAFAVFIEMELEYLLLQHYPLGWSEKMLENIAFIASWMIVALSIFIAEDFGRLKLERTKAELLYLKHQVNPHFLFNTHNNINFLIEQDPALASATLLKLSGIMQYMLYECSANTLPLKREFKNLENYIELEKIRKNDNLIIEYNFIYPDKAYDIAPLLLITFVENAFKHVSNFSDKENYIRINATGENNILDFKISNTKRSTQTSGIFGIGLKNVKQRLQLIYKRRHKLVIDNNSNLFTVHLTIDFST